MDLTREDPNENAHWGEMTGMESRAATECGIQEAYVDPLTKQLIFLLYDTLFCISFL